MFQCLLGCLLLVCFIAALMCFIIALYLGVITWFWDCGCVFSRLLLMITFGIYVISGLIDGDFSVSLFVFWGELQLVLSIS